jgi:DNA-binding NarL/FixJ family response regulator
MSKIRVVLIEDHDLTRFCTKIGLQRSEEVEIIGEAANATDGRKLLETTQPDVAIIDIDLPDMSGIELTRWFKSSATAGFQTKVLMLTLQNTEEMVNAAIAAGANSYCLKTSSLDHLLEALRTTYRGNSWVDPEISSMAFQRLTLIIN